MALGELSRYRGTNTIIADDGGTRYLAWNSLPYTEGGERLYAVTAPDVARPDLIAYRFYGTPELWWLVLDYNKIADPFAIEAGDKLRLPPLTTVRQLLRDRERVSAIINSTAPLVSRPALSRPGLVIPYRPPAYSTPYGVGENETVVTPPAVDYLHTFTLLGPSTQPSTTIHFQLQLAAESTFSTVLLSRMSAVDQDHWTYFDPSSASGAGEFLEFPVTGLPSALFGQQVRWKIPDGTTGITTEVQYYFRYRSIVNQIEQAWSSATAVTFAPL